MRFYIVNSKELTIEAVECDNVLPMLNDRETGELCDGIYWVGDAECAYNDPEKATIFLRTLIDYNETQAGDRLRYIRKARAAVLSALGTLANGGDSIEEFNAAAKILDPLTVIHMGNE